ncbi:protein disulfide-isomerase domain protein [Dictyocaulus viviparus]|uniref:protein disulfide-isomerase n=1 Tax=Dictyocaulus viviparus TaxID=29172 RepID=A0A0D8XGM2_DICVI|nr:protein disulfide-isomerase domain protein [Dictyocaulus viviparus]
MMMLVTVFLLVPVCSALYSSQDNVVELTSANFHNKVITSDDIWVVEFYAPWCGHCKNLVPEYKKAASALKGIVKVGAVDMTQHQSVGSPYNVQGFPTIKIFAADKKKPADYNGLVFRIIPTEKKVVGDVVWCNRISFDAEHSFVLREQNYNSIVKSSHVLYIAIFNLLKRIAGARTAQAIADAALDAVKKVVNSRLGVKSAEGPGSRSSSRGQSDVVELTDENFEKLVLNSNDIWLVEFFAPWCGHCKNLEPHWKAAASQLKDKVKLGALDATVHTIMASKFGIRGFPTIKYFAPNSDANDAVDYDGGRTTSDIVNWANSKVLENLPPPKPTEAIDQDIVEDQCKEKQLCIFAFLPHILDCQSKCRNDYISLLEEMGAKYKRNGWGWIWVEGGAQKDLEDAFGIGGFGYPAMVAMNYRKMKFAMLKGSFGKEGINEFLRDLSFGKGQTAPVKAGFCGAVFPKVVKLEPWDGKDGQPPIVEEIDLSDVDLDHSEL